LVAIELEDRLLTAGSERVFGAERDAHVVARRAVLERGFESRKQHAAAMDVAALLSRVFDELAVGIPRHVAHAHPRAGTNPIPARSPVRSCHSQWSSSSSSREVGAAILPSRALAATTAGLAR